MKPNQLGNAVHVKKGPGKYDNVTIQNKAFGELNRDKAPYNSKEILKMRKEYRGGGFGSEIAGEIGQGLGEKAVDAIISASEHLYSKVKTLAGRKRQFVEDNGKGWRKQPSRRTGAGLGDLSGVEGTSLPAQRNQNIRNPKLREPVKTTRGGGISSTGINPDPVPKMPRSAKPPLPNKNPKFRGPPVPAKGSITGINPNIGPIPVGPGPVQMPRHSFPIGTRD